MIPTQLTLESGVPGVALVGQPVEFIAKLTSPGSSTPVSTTTPIRFDVDNAATTESRPAGLVNGVLTAVFVVTFTKPVPHGCAAAFDGDANYMPSKSNGVPQEVKAQDAPGFQVD